MSTFEYKDSLYAVPQRAPEISWRENVRDIRSLAAKGAIALIAVGGAAWTGASLLDNDGANIAPDLQIERVDNRCDVAESDTCAIEW